ncbi:metalloregulator ArsR/SmtB family transcription factor [Streptomyces sp. NBC_01808]|uniref:ArsR/SmtB family transcription factor n=1 Tax=Streptomyces sp. NBC_01808 TaxID=2975947 RepID=UPI002DDA50B6|nr:metalloregulator ArsR/SmtB family transcription factor [Streptomyces sp. NBC_01808]WSA41507.1 metalloregulator ArsR/SmtB family transcription factor [Streptomyces sp. NBC_01808]
MLNTSALDAPATGTGIPCCPPLDERALTEEEAEQVSRMFKALGDPVRLQLLWKIAARPGAEACVCEVSNVGVARTTVSHHLKKLREAGLLSSERRGTQVYYRVTTEATETLARALQVERGRGGSAS